MLLIQPTIQVRLIKALVYAHTLDRQFKELDKDGDAIPQKSFQDDLIRNLEYLHTYACRVECRECCNGMVAVEVKGSEQVDQQKCPKCKGTGHTIDETRTICELYHDSELSFGFSMWWRLDEAQQQQQGFKGNRKAFYHPENGQALGSYGYGHNGGLLYHGPHDAYGSGSGPTFAVTLNAVHGWSIHT